MVTLVLCTRNHQDRGKEKIFMDQDKVDTFVSAYGQDAKKQNIVSVLFD